MDSTGASSGIDLLPIPTAFTGEACLSCCKHASGSSSSSSSSSSSAVGESRLVRCTRCQRAKYCNATCQRADWSKHKKECKPLKEFREKYAEIGSSIDAAGQRTPRQVVMGKARCFREILCPAMKDNQRFEKFMILSKLCAICGKSEYDFGSDHKWYNCETCHFGWCCSQEHFDDYNTNIHSQNKMCFRFVHSIAMDAFRWRHFQTYKETFTFMPESATFRPPFPTFPPDWTTLFQLRCGDLPVNQLPPEFLPASTLELSQVYTCLYAMYQHKSSLERFFGDADSSEATLTIHVVGASRSFELMPTGLWEEMLHCLPSVNTFNLVFIGPEATQGLMPPSDRLECDILQCCPACEEQGRRRGFYLYGSTYHDYHRDATTLQRAPDLIVAFNTGISQEETDSWKTSLELILDMKVPALFTSYHEGEAKEDYALLSSVMGAKMLTTEPVLNPVRVGYHFIDPCDEGGAANPFFQPNMYAMCFQGKKDQTD